MIEFAELEEFQDLKLKNYSSGMHVRLAFSVAIQVDAEILLIDEVLAVGDAAFQQKCFDVFNRMRDEGRTIIFVTHDMSAVTRFCHRAMLLERGAMVSIGDPRDVADRYLEIAFGRAAGYDGDDVGSTRMGDGAARVSDVWLGDDPSERRTVAPQSEPLTLKVLVTFNSDVRRSGGEHDAASTSTASRWSWPRPRRTRSRRGGFREGERALFAFSFHNMLAPGRYHPVLTITHRGEGLSVIDRYAAGLSFVVSGLTPAAAWSRSRSRPMSRPGSGLPRRARSRRPADRDERAAGRVRAPWGSRSVARAR